MTNVFPLTSESLSFKNYALWELCHHPYIITTWRCSSAIWEHCHTVAGALGILQNLQKRRDFASQSNIKYIKEFPAMTTKELDKVMWMSDVLLDVVDACGCMMIHAGLSEESWFASARWWLTLLPPQTLSHRPACCKLHKGRALICRTKPGPSVKYSALSALFWCCRSRSLCFPFVWPVTILPFQLFCS